MVIFYCVAGGIWAYRAAIVRRVARIINEVGDIGDRSVTPVLVSALAFATGSMRTAIRNALIHRLPMLVEADRHRFSAEHQKLLVTELRKSTGDTYSFGYSPRLGAAILTALSAIGDEEAIPAVRPITQKARTSGNSAMVEAARRCLDTLVARQEQERESRILLRASRTPDDTLLKPMGVGDESTARVLLRPSSTDS